MQATILREVGWRLGLFHNPGALRKSDPSDRTSELRKKGYTGRSLGPKQMSTDTAVRVTRMVTLDRSKEATTDRRPFWLCGVADPSSPAGQDSLR